MNRYIKKTLVKLLILLSLLIMAFGLSIFLLVEEDYFKDITNSCRVLVSDQLNNLSKNMEQGSEPYLYTVISLDGSVIKSTEKEVDKQISLHNLSFDNWYEVNHEGIIRYSTPLIKHEKIESIVIFSIPKEDILNFRNNQGYDVIYQIALLLTFFGIIIIIYRIYKLVTKDILQPIHKMHQSAIEILKGNYLEKISYDYSGEIGEFSHDFEKMRDGLMISSEKEQKLKIAEKELLACISHDLKTPIANISGYCEGIIDGVVKEENDVKRYVNVIHKKARVLTKLLDDILEISKAEINQMSINKQEIYSKEFFDSLLEEISMDVVSSGRELIVEGEVPSLLINIDEDKITQVMTNVMTNSIKYTSVNGIIRVSFERIHEGLEIKVSDNGVGIAAEELPFVFNKFYRGEKHRNQNIPGSGLGLSIAKYIVEAHNGKIKMMSSKESGTVVSIKLRN